MKFVRTGRFIEQDHESLVMYLADGYIDYEDGTSCKCKLGFNHTEGWHGEGIYYPSFAFVEDHCEGDYHYEAGTIDINDERYLEITDDDYEYERSVI